MGEVGGWGGGVFVVDAAGSRKQAGLGLNYRRNEYWSIVRPKQGGQTVPGYDVFWNLLCHSVGSFLLCRVSIKTSMYLHPYVPGFTPV